MVIANTGDDVDMYGVRVSPDPDLVTYWLADEIDERGYGLRGDTFEVMAALESAGRPAWFRLGDRDLAMCLIRSERLQAGRRLTEAHAAVVEAMGVRARVLPMSDQRVSTWVGAAGKMLPFQEYMIVEGAPAPIETVELRGVEGARPTDEVLAALAEAEAIVIGPSNPVVSIGTILALPGMREALAGCAGAGRGGEPARGRPVAQGADGGVLRLRGHRAERDGDRPRLRGSARRHGGGRGGRGRDRARDRHGHGHRARDAATRREDARVCEVPWVVGGGLRSALGSREPG